MHRPMQHRPTLLSREILSVDEPVRRHVPQGRRINATRCEGRTHRRRSARAAAFVDAILIGESRAGEPMWSVRRAVYPARALRLPGCNCLRMHGQRAFCYREAVTSSPLECEDLRTRPRISVTRPPTTGSHRLSGVTSRGRSAGSGERPAPSADSRLDSRVTRRPPDSQGYGLQLCALGRGRAKHCPRRAVRQGKPDHAASLC